MRQVVVFALIAILLVVPVTTTMGVVAGLAPNDAIVTRAEAAALVIESVSLRSLTLLRAPPV